MKNKFTIGEKVVYEFLDIPEDEISYPFKLKKPINLAIELAEYGIYGAGGDDTPEQQDWGADCIEAAIYLWRQTANAIIEDTPDKLRLVVKEYTKYELIEKVKEMRQRARDLRKEEKR